MSEKETREAEIAFMECEIADALNVINFNVTRLKVFRRKIINGRYRKKDALQLLSAAIIDLENVQKLLD